MSNLCDKNGNSIALDAITLSSVQGSDGQVLTADENGGCDWENNSSTPSQEQIASAVSDYLGNNPVDKGYSDCRFEWQYITDKCPYYFADTEETLTSYDSVNYLESKLKSIPEGKHFVFIADTHWDDNGHKKSIITANYLRKKLGCKVLFGGDAIVSSYVSKYAALKLLANFADEAYAAMGDDLLWTQGNHDSNVIPYVSDKTTYPASSFVINDNEVFKRTIANQKNCMFDEDALKNVLSLGLEGADLEDAIAYLKFHYYFDDTDTKIRFIVLETGCGGTTLINQCNRVYNNVVPLSHIWLSEVLKSTPSGWDVVVCGHQINGFDGGKNAYGLARLLTAFKNGTSTTVNMIADNTSSGTPFTQMLCGTKANRSFNFTDCAFSGKLIVLSGHYHNDYAQLWQDGSIVEIADITSTTPKDTYFIRRGTDNPSRDKTGAVRTLGTVSETLFDIVTINDTGVTFTRIGSGDDVTYDFNI